MRQRLPRRVAGSVVRPVVRLLLVAAAIAAAACADSTTAPQSKRLLTPTTPRYDEIDSSMCRSGYNLTQGRCN